jgi:hypothetical protein
MHQLPGMFLPCAEVRHPLGADRAAIEWKVRVPLMPRILLSFTLTGNPQLQ